MVKKIWFDLDGTIVDLYGVDGWLNMLQAYDPTPYKVAKPMVNMANLAKLLHKAQRLGYEVGVISWLSKTSTAEYDMAVTEVKVEWLRSHLPSVEWNEIKIVAYGTPKHELCEGWLFDDEEYNRQAWGEGAYKPSEIMEMLRGLR